MKKILPIGLMAICCIAWAHQETSAWTNHRFNIGLGWQRQSGGNDFLHIWHNGQPPGPEAYGITPSYHQHFHHYVAPMPLQTMQPLHSYSSVPAHAAPMQYSPHHQVQSGYAGYGPQPVYHSPYHGIQAGYAGYGH